MIKEETTSIPLTGDLDANQASLDVNDTLNQMLQDLMNLPSTQNEMSHDSAANITTSNNPNQNCNGVPKNIDYEPIEGNIDANDNIPAPKDLTDNYLKIKNIFSNILFGRNKDILQSSISDPSIYLNINSNKLPFILNIFGLPHISRAENQMYLTLSLSQNPSIENRNNIIHNCNYPIYIHLPTNSIAKEKFYLNENYETLQNLPQVFTDRILFIEAFLVSTTNHNLINVCSKCVLREKKRYSRRKSGLCDNILWCNNPNRNAILFFNRQLFPLQRHNVRYHHPNAHLKEITIELKTRITCYCKHHMNTDSFQILFVIRDSKNNILAKELSDSIVIMGKKTENLNNKVAITNSTRDFAPNVTTPDSSISNTDSPMTKSAVKINIKNYPLPSPVSSLSSVSSTSSTNSEDSNYDNLSNNCGNIQTEYIYNTNNFYKQEELISNMNFITGNIRSMNQAGNFNQENGVSIPITNHPSVNSNTPPNHISNFNCSQMNNNNNNNSDIRKRVKHSREYNPSLSSSIIPLNNDLSSSSLLSLQQLPKSIQDNVYNKRAADNFASSFSSLPTLIPSIHKIIPSQGPTSGGIEITLLGSNFKPGQIVEFGNNRALSSQVWNSTTMVTYLPPSPKAGQVIVTIRDSDSRDTNKNSVDNNSNLGTHITENGVNNHNINNDVINLNNGPIFTYIDNTDKQMIELALQIVGLRMNGKLDDPRNIAKQIIDSTNHGWNFESNGSSNSNNNTTNYSVNSAFNKYSENTELLLSDIINKSENFNIMLRDEKGRTLLHYSCLKGYVLLSETLIKVSDSKLCEIRDNFEYLPMHFAAVNGNHDIINLMKKANVYSNNSNTILNGYTCRDLYIINHAHNDEKSFSEWSESDIESISENLVVDREGVSSNVRNVHGEATNVEQGESLWNKLMHKLNDDILPKYEDIFPKEYIDYSINGKMNHIMTTTENVNTKISNLEATIVDEHEEQDDYEDPTENNEDIFREILFFERNDNFKNDRMLLYFWLPLLVLLSSFMLLYIMGNKDDWIHYVNDIVSNFFRGMLTKLFVGRQSMSTSIKNRLSNFQPSKLLEDFPKSIDFKLAV